MHLNDLQGLEGKELAEKQIEIFTAFLKDGSLDIGLGTLQVTHIQGAIYLAEEHANARGLKKWHPQYEQILHMLGTRGDVLPKAEFLRIAALSWYAWGVLNEHVAFYGEHLITLGLLYFGYNRFDTAIHSLPYMRDWFTTSLSRDNDPIYSSYVLWLDQLKLEKESVSKLASVSNASDKETTSLLTARTKRLRNAENHEFDWLVEWLRTSINHESYGDYNTFQAVLLQNPPVHGLI